MYKICLFSEQFKNDLQLKNKTEPLNAFIILSPENSLQFK